jgi:hypothetical protein
MLEGSNLFNHGTKPDNSISSISLEQLKAWEEVVEKGTNWRLLGAAPKVLKELQV